MNALRERPSLLSQVLMTFCSQSGGYVVTVLAGIAIARGLGPSGKGIVTYATLLLSIFTTYGGGLQSAMMYQGGRERPVSAIFAAALRIIGFAFVPVALAFFAFGLLVPEHAVFAFVACVIPCALYAQAANSVMLFEHDVRSTVIGSLFTTVGFAAMAVPLVVFAHSGPMPVLAAWAIAYIAAAVYAAVRVARFVPPLGLAATAETIREQVWFSLKTGSVSIADFLNLRVDVFVVSLMLDARALGIYSLAIATGEMMWQLSRPLVWTTIGRIASSERQHAIDLTAKVTRHIVALQIVIGSIVFLVAPFAVRLVYGNAYAEAGDLVRWLMPGLILYAAHGALGYFVMVKDGRPLLIFAIQSTSVVACAAISAIMIPHIGLFGAALATTVTYCGAALAKAVFFARSSALAPLAFTVPNGTDLDRIRGVVERVVRSRWPGRKAAELAL